MRLRTYIIRRLLLFIPLFFIVSIIIFTLIHLTPGDPVTIMFATNPYGGELKQMMIERYGLDKPLLEQYFIWLSKILQGDFGYSYLRSRPVSEMIAIRLWPTIELVLISQLCAILLSIVLGVVSAVKRNSKTDKVCSFFALIGRGMPNFWIALNMIFFFSLTLGWLPVSGMSSSRIEFESPWLALGDHLLHLILPVTAITIYYVAYLFRIIRSSMLDVLGKEYIVTARAKGLKESIVIYKHALRNALLPAVTIVGIWMGYLFGGAVVIETIFSWPGLGSFVVSSTYNREYMILMGVNMIIVMMVLSSNLITDIVLASLDPRIRY